MGNMEFTKKNVEEANQNLSREKVEEYCLDALLYTSGLSKYLTNDEKAEVDRLKTVLQERTKLPRKSDRGLTISEWSFIQRLMLKAKMKSRESHVDEETSTLLEQLRKNIELKREMENPEDAREKGLEFMFKKYIENFIAIHAIDIYKIAGNIGVIGPGKDLELADKVVHTESFVRKFSDIFFSLQRHGVTVGQIVDIKKDGKLSEFQKTQKILSLTLKEDQDGARTLTDTPVSIEYHQELIAAGLIMNIYSDAIVDNKLENLIKQRAIKEGQGTTDNKLLSTDPNFYTRETPVGEAMQIILTAHIGNHETAAIRGLANGIRKSFGPEASPLDRIKGLGTGLAEAMKDIAINSEDAITEFISKKYSTSGRINAEKLGRAIKIIGSVEMDETESITRLLEVNSIQLNSNEEKILKDLILSGQGKKLESAGEKPITERISSILRKIPESSPEGSMWSELSTNKIITDLDTQWKQSATMDDVIAFSGLCDAYESPEMKSNPEAQHKMSLIVIGALASWMDHHDLKDNAHDIGIRVAKEMTGTVINKIGDYAQKLSEGKVDLSDKTMATLYYEAKRHGMPTGFWKGIYEGVKGAGSSLKDLNEIGHQWPLIISTFSIVALNILSLEKSPIVLRMIPHLLNHLIPFLKLTNVKAWQNWNKGNGLSVIPDRATKKTGERIDDVKRQEVINEINNTQRDLESLRDKVGKMTGTDLGDPKIAEEISRTVERIQSQMDGISERIHPGDPMRVQLEEMRGSFDAKSDMNVIIEHLHSIRENIDEHIRPDVDIKRKRKGKK